MTFRLRLVASSLVLSAGALLFSAPAQAVQTTTWGITAAHGTTLAHSSDGSTVHETVLVYNRTASPITINLYVLATAYHNGVYLFSKPTTGLAAHTTLATHTVALGSHQQVQVPVTVTLPRNVKTTMLAGIGAEAAPLDHGELTLKEQLVVLVKATPTSGVLPIHLSAPDITGWGASAASLLLIVVIWMIRQRRRTNRLAPLAA